MTTERFSLHIRKWIYKIYDIKPWSFARLLFSFDSISKFVFPFLISVSNSPKRSLYIIRSFFNAWISCLINSIVSFKSVSVSIDTTSQNRNDKIRRNNIVATSILGSIIKLLTTNLVQIVLASYMKVCYPYRKRNRRMSYITLVLNISEISWLHGPCRC